MHFEKDGRVEKAANISAKLQQQISPKAWGAPASDFNVITSKVKLTPLSNVLAILANLIHIASIPLEHAHWLPPAIDTDSVMA